MEEREDEAERRFKAIAERIEARKGKKKCTTDFIEQNIGMQKQQVVAHKSYRIEQNTNQ